MPGKHIAFGASVAALLAIFVTAGLVGGLVFPADVAVIRRFQEVRAQSPTLTSAMIALTHMGSIFATMGGGLLIGLWLWLRGQRRRGVVLAATVIGERLTVDGIKLLIDRARPAFDVHPVVTHSASFPSGHAANSMAVFLTVALVAVPPRHRRLAATVAVVMSVLIGLSRCYLGVHWPSDVIAGWALGAAVALIAARIANREAR